MRVQRAVAVALLSLVVGCGRVAMQGQASQADVVWARHPAGGAALAAASVSESLALAVDDEDDGDDGDRAEGFLAGRESLWPAAEHPKVVSRASRLRREMPGLLRLGIERSGRYMEIIEREFEREGLPIELAYLPIVESTFSQEAVGRGVVGLWQFTSGTARKYGLIVNREVDERRDPEKASRAAAQLLRDLYDRFDSWDLAIAAYNAGPARIERALARQPGADFWKLADRGLLPGVTTQYVPKVLATALIASRPERYGLTEVDRSDPLRYDKAVVSQRLDVATIATLCGSSRADVAELNPSLKVGVVPQTPTGYEVRLPEGSGELFQERYAAWRSTRGENG
jgi:peptidoglycan lytic transglycosylase D